MHRRDMLGPISKQAVDGELRGRHFLSDDADDDNDVVLICCLLRTGINAVSKSQRPATAGKNNSVYALRCASPTVTALPFNDPVEVQNGPRTMATRSLYLVFT